MDRHLHQDSRARTDRLNGLDTQRKVEDVSRVVLGDCGGVGRRPRLGGVTDQVFAGSKQSTHARSSFKCLS